LDKQHQSYKKLTKGCSQGSSCGPGFWNMNFDSLLKLKLKKRCKLKGFADDSQLRIRAKSILELEVNANSSLARIVEWGKQQKLNFNADKTTAVLFTNRLKYEKPRIIMNGQTIELQNSFKYLGIIIDNKLRFTKHITQVKGKAIGLTMSLLRFVKNNYGLNKNNFLSTLYKGVIQPIASYGCALWFEKVDQILFKTTLNQIQRLIAILCCSGYKTVASDAVTVLANLMPLDLHIKQRVAEVHLKRGIRNSNIEEIFNKCGLMAEYYQMPVKHKDKPHLSQKYNNWRQRDRY